MAQLTEKSRSTLSKLSLDDASDIEAEISQLVLESPEPEESSSFSIVITFNIHLYFLIDLKCIFIFFFFKNASVDSEVPITYSWMPPWQGSIQKPPLILLNQQAVTKNVQTVEELERNLLQQRECRDIHKNNVIINYNFNNFDHHCISKMTNCVCTGGLRLANLNSLAKRFTYKIE